MKLAIVGSRSWRDRQMIRAALVEMKPTLLISGGARGADSIAVEEAKRLGIRTRVYSPDWSKYGKQAGPIRNQQIVDDCDWLIAFWDGASPGTEISIGMARAQDKLLKVYKK